MASSRCLFKTFVFSFILIFIILLIVGIQILGEDDLDDIGIFHDLPMDYDIHEELSEDGIEAANRESIAEPVILWWTPFTKEHTIKSCGNVKCFFTNDKHYKEHKNLKVFLFYGTDTHFGNLPLPRQPHHEWALLHEESPKNVFMFSHAEVMEMFNHTSTFKRESDFPITTQYLESIESLESTKYLVSTTEKNQYQSEGQALVNYVHSDCGTYSDRDHLIEMVQRKLQVDSYGKCLHNKDLPEHLSDAIPGMDHKDFYRLQAKYKFTFATENAICDDYITEKLWRPLSVGSVPIVLGSPKLKDFLPTEKSAIFVSDFKTVDELVDYLLYLDKNDEEYEKYLSFKKAGGVTNKLLLETMEKREWAINNDYYKPNFISTFECEVCKRVHENLERVNQGLSQKTYQANVTHYGCPMPTQFSDDPKGSLSQVKGDWWGSEWISTYYRARALKEFITEGVAFTEQDLFKRGSSLEYENRHRNGL